MGLPREMQKLPSKKSARQLVHQMRCDVRDMDTQIGELDAPVTREGAIALQEVTRRAEAVFELSFVATEKATEQEVALGRLRDKVKFMEQEREQETKQNNKMIGDLADRTKAAERRADELERKLMRYELTD